jgi:cell division transport system ATP-binding protein
VSAGDPVVRVAHVSKTYPGGTVALRDVSLEVARGEFVFVMGPSGSGKTTLLRLLLRQELPSEGKIQVLGHDLPAMGAARVPQLRRALGFVFQDFKLIRRKTALENVGYVLNVAGLPPAEQRRRAYNALKAVGLHHRIHVLPPALSGGEQQRVAIARAVVNEPLLLLADEPTGNLDPDLAVDIMRLFREINARGTAVVVATHDRELVRRMQRRFVVLDGGRVVPPEEVPV